MGLGKRVMSCMHHTVSQSRLPAPKSSAPPVHCSPIQPVAALIFCHLLSLVFPGIIPDGFEPLRWFLSLSDSALKAGRSSLLSAD